MYEIFETQVILKTKTCECEGHPRCPHSEWRTECPICKEQAHSIDKHGPYECPNGHGFMVAVSGYYHEADLDDGQEE